MLQQHRKLLGFCQRGIKVSPSTSVKFSVQSLCLIWEDGALTSREEEKGYSRSTSEPLNWVSIMNSHLEELFYFFPHSVALMRDCTSRMTVSCSYI